MHVITTCVYHSVTLSLSHFLFATVSKTIHILKRKNFTAAMSKNSFWVLATLN